MITYVSTVNLQFLLLVQFLQPSSGAVNFSHHPPSVVYVQTVKTARFVWDYFVDDKNKEFSLDSPRWDFYDSNNRKSTIATESNAGSGWQWTVHTKTCPARLLNPTVRVSKESTATLVISNATTADNGVYACTLVLSAGSPIVSKVQLTVTVPPKFSSSLPVETYNINEGEALEIECTATGPPTPNITWVNITDGSVFIKAQGSGTALLHINNIKRYHAGVYECQAQNNPNEAATTTRTHVTVYYKPTLSEEKSSSYNTSWNGRQVTLKCIVSDGLPTPDITWYKPSGQKIRTSVTAIAKGSHVVITTKDGADYGLYKCKATNIAGSVEHVINVTQLFSPGTANATVQDQDIQASSVTVRWTKPGYDGGSHVIDYKVQINANPPQEENTPNTVHEFTGLTKNTRYEVRVYTRNVVGYGNASIIIFTTKKKGPPPLPILHLNKSKTTITLSWTKPDENGGEIKNYTIYQKQGVEPWTRVHVIRNLSNLTYVIHMKDLEPGQTYWFIVTATNEFGESEIGDDKGKEAYILPTPVTTTTQATTTAVGLNKGKRTTNVDGESNAAVIPGVVGAVLFMLLVGIILGIIIIKKKGLLSKGFRKKSPSNRAAYDNDVDPDSANQQAAAAGLGGTDDGIPTYAAVDMTQKKKKNDIPDYAVVDTSKKKRPGEIIYAELADFNTAGSSAAAAAPRPIAYTSTDYADITQFQQQEEPEPTYANFPGRGKKYTDIQGLSEDKTFQV